METSNRGNSRYASASERLEARVLSEWLGVPLPIDTRRRVSRAGDHLEKLLSQLGVTSGIDEETLLREWGEIAGEFVARHTRPVRLIEGRLDIKVLQPAMRFHLEQMKPALTAKVRDRLGAEKIKFIRFVLG